MNDIEDFDKKLKDAQESFDPSSKKKALDTEDVNKRVGMQMGAELIGSVVGGLLVGLGLDHWLGTKPFFLILMLFVGMISGFYNMYRLSNNHGSAIGYAHLHKGLREDEKDAKTAPEKIDDDLNNLG